MSFTKRFLENQIDLCNRACLSKPYYISMDEIIDMVYRGIYIDISNRYPNNLDRCNMYIYWNKDICEIVETEKKNDT